MCISASSGLAVKRGDDEQAAEQKEQAPMLVGLTEDQLILKNPGPAHDLAMVDSQGRRWNIAATDLWADFTGDISAPPSPGMMKSQTQRRMEQLLELQADRSGHRYRRGSAA